VTLYEALAGRLPFPAQLGEGILPQLGGQPDPLDLEPPELAELLFGCLANRPSERPTAAEVAAALEPLVAELPRPRLSRFRPGGRLRSLPARIR
jgi:serine/threonine-protein kinase